MVQILYKKWSYHIMTELAECVSMALSVDWQEESQGKEKVAA
jgi:hypothetical protein